MAAQHNNMQMIYKRYETPATQPQQSTETMDPATATSWNQWFSESFSIHIARHARVIAEAIGSEAGRDHRELSDQIASLRAEIEILKAHKAGKDGQ